MAGLKGEGNNTNRCEIEAGRQGGSVECVRLHRSQTGGESEREREREREWGMTWWVG